MRKWKPSKSARREFAQNMQNETFASNYYARKEARAENRRSTSQFDYETAGGNYIPTQYQHDFCLDHYDLFNTPEKRNAANMVMSGYSCQDKVHHDYIHIVNEIIRHNSI
jgi:hypothetical protein